MHALSLASRFLITLLVSAVVPLLLYGWFSLRGMREQIDEQVVRVFLPQLAADFAQKIETRLERTDQACAMIREMSRQALDEPDELPAFEARVQLVPNLLSNFLDLLILADADGEVVYWQDGHRLDPSKHETRATLIPDNVVDAPWFMSAQEDRGMHFVPWHRSAYLHRGVDFRSMDPSSYHLGIAMDVPKRDGTSGVLFALLRWSEVQSVIDAAKEVLVVEARLPSADVFLVGRNGGVQAHTDRSFYGLELDPPELAVRLAAASTQGRCASLGRDGRMWRVGYAPGGSDQERAFVLGVAVPESELFAASNAFERVLLFAILMTIVVLVLFALLASRAITAPVKALVNATRRVALGEDRKSVV